MKRLVASDEQCRRFLRVEGWPEQSQRLLGPISWRSIGGDAQFKPIRCGKHPVRVLKSTGFDAVNPDHEGLAEGRARLWRRANEISDHGAAGFNHPVAHPAHPA